MGEGTKRSRFARKSKRGESRQAGRPTDRPTEPLMKFRPSRTELPEKASEKRGLGNALVPQRVSLKEQIIYAPSLRNHFCQKEQTP